MSKDPDNGTVKGVSPSRFIGLISDVELLKGSVDKLQRSVSDLDGDLKREGGRLSESITRLTDVIQDLNMNMNKTDKTLEVLSEKIAMVIVSFRTAVPLKLVVLLLFSTIISLGIGKEIDILFKIMHGVP